ncbi:helix-turn-helix transcriptional regulator [Celerinatantimonas yamalensis]|uniref:Helix-turn-helix transcriptional regulator n=1 Tax=Celerinatantimonas yamalensis TaxID=559956 RepID=A0ABW9G5U2_9GAMM
MLETDNLLGQFIRVHRQQLTPPEQTHGRRRTPGYRREELAQAAGLSTTWLTRLEQGRSLSASVTVLARLSQALQLNPAERATLFELAGKFDPYSNTPALAQKRLIKPLQDLPDQFHGPCYLLDSSWNALCWNHQAAQLFIGWLDIPNHDRNLLRYTFLNQQARQLIPNWAERAQRLVAEFRLDYTHQSEDPQIIELIDELTAQSTEFAALWQNQQVRYRDGGSRYFAHPQWGECQFQQVTLQVSAIPELKLVCLLEKAIKDE